MTREYFHDQELLMVTQNKDDILIENQYRWVMFPIKYKTFWNYYKEIESLFWTAEDYNFDKDKQYLESIDKKMLSKLLELVCFYSLKDLQIYEEQSIKTSKMLDIIQIPEGRAFYGFQMCMENIHDEVYSCIFENYAPDMKQKKALINKVEKLNSVLKKQKWVAETFKDKIPFFNMLILIYISKVLLNGALQILIGYCKENSILPCLLSVHQKIHRDEYLHGDFSVMCCNHLNHKLKYEHVLEYFKAAVELEYQFSLEFLELDVMKIKKDQVKSFLEYLADTMLANLNYPKYYNSKYPFSWPEFDKINVNQHQKAKSVKKSDDIYGKKHILFDEDF